MRYERHRDSVTSSTSENKDYFIKQLQSKQVFEAEALKACDKERLAQWRFIDQSRY